MSQPVTWVTIGAAACAVLCNAAAQVLMKHASVGHATDWQRWFSVPMTGAVVLYGISFLLTALVYARLPLSCISVFSVIFLGESINVGKILGIGAVLIGVMLLARQV
jgi:multidrug transporter EmrE-like cation transporter